MVAVIRCDDGPGRVRLGLGQGGETPIEKESDMCFILAGCVFLVAILASVVVEDGGDVRRPAARRGLSPFDGP
jgi:hypothetical protein